MALTAYKVLHGAFVCALRSPFGGLGLDDTLVEDPTPTFILKSFRTHCEMQVKYARLFRFFCASPKHCYDLKLAELKL